MLSGPLLEWSRRLGGRASCAGSHTEWHDPRRHGGGGGGNGTVPSPASARFGPLSAGRPAARGMPLSLSLHTSTEGANCATPAASGHQVPEAARNMARPTCHQNLHCRPPLTGPSQCVVSNFEQSSVDTHTLRAPDTNPAPSASDMPAVRSMPSSVAGIGGVLNTPACCPTQSRGPVLALTCQWSGAHPPASLWR
jgi:hypothetical protein